jgi:hypothetical protein
MGLYRVEKPFLTHDVDDIIELNARQAKYYLLSGTLSDNAPVNQLNNLPQMNAQNAITGLLIPLYIEPADIFSNADYNRIISLKKTYHFIPVTVVLNPENGPGTAADADFTQAIKRLQGAGVMVTGYISTDYGERSTALVKAEVDCWRSFYPAIDGIFFDEMNTAGGGEAYYANLYQYAHNHLLSPVIGNPGADIGGSYFSTLTADIIIIHDGAGVPTVATLKGDAADGYSDYLYSRRAAWMYDVSNLDSGDIAAASEHLGMIYVTDADLPDPWAALPSYLEDLFYNLAMIAIGTPQVEPQ